MSSKSLSSSYEAVPPNSGSGKFPRMPSITPEFWPVLVLMDVCFILTFGLFLGSGFSSLRSFPHSSVVKESVCKAGDAGSIPGSGRSAGEGIGYPLQYSWSSLVAQLVKNPPAMRETWVLPIGWEDHLEKGKATHSSILAWRIPWTV